MRCYSKFTGLLAFTFVFTLSCSKKGEEKKEPQLSISGTIQVKASLAKHTKDSDVIFLIARAINEGPPVAVKRFAGKKYPYPFTIAQEDLMIAERKVQKPLNLTVRVDKDGDPMTKKPGDLTGTYERNPVSIHSENVVITIDRMLTE